MRKNVLEYDDVMNLQRIAIYKERNAILDGKDLDALVSEMIEDAVDGAIDTYCPEGAPIDDWELDKLAAWITAMTGEEAESGFGIDLDADEDIDAEELRDSIVDQLCSRIDAKRAVVGDEAFAHLETQIMLRMLDTHWLLHLQDMERLKTGIGLRALGHRDPLTEYKEEAFEAFSDLVDSVYEAFVRTLLRMPVERPVEDIAPKEEDNPFRFDKLVYSNTDTSGATNDSTGGDMHDDRVL